jgi:hypothetical protein
VPIEFVAGNFKPAARLIALQRAAQGNTSPARTEGYLAVKTSQSPLPRGEDSPSPYFFTLARSARLSNLSASPPAHKPRLAIRCTENALNGFIDYSIELSVRLLSRQPFNQRPGKAGDHAMIFTQTIVCFFL